MTKDEAEKEKKCLEESLSLSKDSVAFLEQEIESTKIRLGDSLKNTAVEQENAKVKDKTIHSLQVSLEQATTDFQLVRCFDLMYCMQQLARIRLIITW